MFRPTITDMQYKYCGNFHDTYLIQSQYTKVAAFDRHNKRGDAAFGRATSFVVSFVFDLNGANIVSVMVGLNMFDCTSVSSPFGESLETLTAKYHFR